MSDEVVCQGCGAVLGLSAEQASKIGFCPHCHRVVAESGPTAQDLVPEPVSPDEMADNCSLELGPGWRGIERALGWVRFATGAWLFFLVCAIFAAMVRVQAMPERTQVDLPLLAGLACLTLMAFLALCLAGFALLLGRVACLRVPRGTGCRPLAAISLVATVLIPVGAGGAVVSQVEGTLGGLVGFLCGLASLALVLISELAFLTFLSRLGRFLELPAMRFHARVALIVVVLYSFVTAMGAILAPVLVGTGAVEGLTVAVVASFFQIVAWCLIVAEYRNALGEGIDAIARARSLQKRS